MKIGDYVRTNYGSIVKIEAIDEEVTLSDKGYIDKESVFKSSPNIIDLIEVGDYVNGYKVLFIDYDLSKTKNIKCIDNEEERQCFYEQDIKSIVTKEKFESMEYEVK